MWQMTWLVVKNATLARTCGLPFMTVDSQILNSHFVDISYFLAIYLPCPINPNYQFVAALFLPK